MNGEHLVRLLRGLAGRGREIVFVTGGIGAGKSSACLEAARVLRAGGLAVGGVISRRLLESGDTAGYDAVNLLTGEARILARTVPPGAPVGRFFVRPEGLAFAAEALEGAACGASVVFVDEIGPWELQGGGLAPSLRDLLPRPLVLVLVVRAGLVEAVRQVFAIPEGRVWEVPPEVNP